MKYQEIRSNIQVGDVVLYEGDSLIDRTIRLVEFWKKQDYRFSHTALVYKTQDGCHLNVMTIEEVGKGLEEIRLSEAIKQHGKVYLLSMNCTPEQQASVYYISEVLLREHPPYDYFASIQVLFRQIILDTGKFNCSELVWFALRSANRVGAKTNWNGREIAPTPGEFPSWVGVEPMEVLI